MRIRLDLGVISPKLVEANIDTPEKKTLTNLSKLSSGNPVTSSSVIQARVIIVKTMFNTMTYNNAFVIYKRLLIYNVERKLCRTCALLFRVCNAHAKKKATGLWLRNCLASLT